MSKKNPNEKKTSTKIVNKKNSTVSLNEESGDNEFSE